jgi:hypothetical protein
VLEAQLPPHLASRWQVAPSLTPERFRWIRNRIAAITLAVTTLIGLGGLVAWWRSGDPEILVTALFYAGL